MTPILTTVRPIPYPKMQSQSRNAPMNLKVQSVCNGERRSDVLDGLVAGLLVGERGGRGRSLPDDTLGVLLMCEVAVEEVDVSGRDHW